MSAGMCFRQLFHMFHTYIDFNSSYWFEKIQVYAEVSSLIELCRVQIKAVQLTSSMPLSDMVCVSSFTFDNITFLPHASFSYNFFFFQFQRNALAGLPEILVTTPACIPKCFADGVLDPAAISDSLEILVLDEV